MWRYVTFLLLRPVYNILEGDTNGRTHEKRLSIWLSGKEHITMTDELKNTIGRNLKVARWKHNWSQDFVSKQTGLSIRTISRAETGRGLSKDTLKRLCSFYAVRMESIYSEDSQKTTAQVHIEPIPFDMVIRLLSQSSFVNDIQREAVLQFNDTVQRNALMCSQDITDIIPEVINEKKSYTASDIIQCCLEVNRRTVMNISQIAIA